MYVRTKIKVIAVFSFTVLALGLAVSTGSTQTQVETAGQKFKNIKVLNDMPADQLGKVMNIFSASLGVDCNYCHEGEDFAKDGKRSKETARNMIKMVIGINKDHFNGRPQVTCNSCHNGHEQPTNVPNLSPVEEPARPAQPATKPTVDQIVDKYITALGGAEKLAKVTSLAVKANRVEHDGKTLRPESIWYKSNKYLSVTNYDKAVVTEKFDGTTATKMATGHDAIVLKPDEVEQIKREADLFAPANLKTIYPTMAFNRVDRIDGREVNIVVATTKSNIREVLSFDVQTGLLVRRTTSTQTMFGRFVYQVDYADYKPIGGVKMPMTVKYAMPGIRWTRKVLEAKVNAPIDDATFMK